MTYTWGLRFFLLAAAVAGASVLAAAIPRSPSPDVAAPVPQRAKRRPPEPAKPRRLSPEDAEHLFRRILQVRRDEFLQPGLRCGTRGPWLSEDRRSYRPEARLFAKAYPDLARRLVLELLEDQEAPTIDRSFAYFMMGSLEEWPSTRLEEALQALAWNSEEYSGYLPVWHLGLRDRVGRHREFYASECRRGNSAAFEILSWSVHPDSIALFRELSRQSRTRHWPLGSIPDEAEDALERVEILQSAAWSRKVEALLRDPRENDIRQFMWAYQVAKRRGLPSLLDCLAERARSTAPAGIWVEEEINLHALALYAEEGGELRPAEFSAMRENGFAGDPEERLLEIAAEYGKYGRR